MKKSKSMTTDSNLYSGDDEGFESSAEKVDYKFYLGDHDDGKVMITGNQSDPTELKTDNDEEESRGKCAGINKGDERRDREAAAPFISKQLPSSPCCCSVEYTQSCSLL